jgi:competence ComEA-like helix-hairpin-helix protein
MRYTRRQLLLLLIVLAAGAAGLGVRQWRAAYPELATRLEEFDRRPDEAPQAPGRRTAATDLPATPSVAPSPWPEAAGAPAPEPDESRLDLNRATTDDLSRLPGVGPVLAARIVAARNVAGRFQAVDDLRGVGGLGRVKLERVRPLITVGD